MSAPLPSPPPALEYPAERPTDRAGCLSMPRPCPFMSCRHHLALDISRKRKGLRPINEAIASAIAAAEAPPPPGLTPNELGAHTRKTDAALADALAALPHTCALDVADDGAHTLLDMGEIMGGISRERVRQIEHSAQAKLAHYGIVLDLAEDFGLDTSAPTYLARCGANAHRSPRPSPAQGHTPPRRPDVPSQRSGDGGVFAGDFEPQQLTAKMRRVQAESAPPVRTLSPADVDLAALEAEIAAKHNPLHKPRPLVTLDTFGQRAEASRMRAGEATASTARITTPSAKAPATTPPRPPSTPSPSPFEIPPQDPPATVQADDQPEVAVVTALPESPTPKAKPMPPHEPRSTWSAQAAYAAERLRQTMLARGLTPVSLAQRIVADLPHLDARSTEVGIRKIVGSGDHASPKSIIYRRCANALGITLDDLCDDAAWVAAIPTEDNPAGVGKHHPSTGRAPQKPAPTPPPPAKTPPPSPTPTSEAALAPLILDLLTKSQAQDKRVSELTAVSDLLRQECDDLREQLAAATKERDAATNKLAQIKAAL